MKGTSQRRRRTLVVAAVTLVVTVASSCRMPADAPESSLTQSGSSVKDVDASGGSYQSGISTPVGENWGGRRLWVRWRSDGSCDAGVQVTTDGRTSSRRVGPKWSNQVLGDSVRDVTIDPAGCTIDIDHLSSSSRPFIGKRLTPTTSAPSNAPTAISDEPTAVWLTNPATATGAVSSTLSRASATATVPVFVLYMRPQRDCGGYSSSNTASGRDEYLGAVTRLSKQLAAVKSIVVVEPDAAAQDCGDPTLVAEAVRILGRNSSVHTYLDAGHPGWRSVDDMVGRLRDYGVADADGVALNVSNFVPLGQVRAYGEELSDQLDKDFVVDTSRSGGDVPKGEWCNPSGARLGPEPTFNTASERLVAELWVKQPGESDGTCNGGPSAGTWWPSGAERLAS